METAARARLVETTARLLQVQGYHNTGLNQIVAESAAPKGSLYHYFPGGKEQLAVETLGQASDRIRDALERLLATGSAPDALRAYSDVACRRLQRTDFAEGCPVGNTALEASVGSSAVRDACDHAFRDWEAVIAERLARDGIEPSEAARLATFIVATFEGALLVARARRDTEPIVQAGDQLAAIVENALPSGD